MVMVLLHSSISVLWRIIGQDSMKKFLPLLFIISIMLFSHRAHAATMLLQHVPTTAAGQEQFYVDVAVDPQGGDFNGVQGTVSFSGDTLHLVRIETGSSILSYFVDQPSLQGTSIHFSGIIVGGFQGLINPFDQSHTLPGEIMRLVFEGKSPGNALITTSNASITANDGDGTLQNLTDSTASLTVTNDIAPSMYTTADMIPPTISASVVSDKNLFDGKYVLIYTAVDKQSGIDHVQLKEGKSDWKNIESPYELQDQSRRGILSVRAYDVAGNVTTITLPSTASTTSVGAIIFLCILALIIFYVIHKKSKHPKHLRHHS